MKRYIRDNFKSVLATTFLVVATVAFISTNELIAKALPEATEMQLVSCNFVGGEEFAYTGVEVTPQIEQIVYYDDKLETTISIPSEEILVTYMDNINVGYADVEVQMGGFRGSLLIEDVFMIEPAAVSNVELLQTGAENLHITWSEVVGADGYVLHRKAGEDAEYEEYVTIQNGKITGYVDSSIQSNTLYEYYVTAYMLTDGSKMYGDSSEACSYLTELEFPEMSEITSKSYDSLEVSWKQIKGASGYELYRSSSKNGEYVCIATISDGEVHSYVDKKRECGKEYFYYIKTIQVVGEETRVGAASGVISGIVKPNSSKITGSTNSECTEVSLSWGEASGATGYELYKSVGNSSNYKLVKTYGANDNRTWSETGLDADSSVFYRVRTFCERNGQKVYSSYSNAFQKKVKINMNYGSGSGNLAGVTQYVGTPYVWGGTTPSGWDCSGFTKWVMANYCGKNIPSGSIAQGKNGASVSMNDRSQWQSGDILVYSNGSRISHVALYIGNGQIIHALNSKYGTVVQGVDQYESWDPGNYLVSVRRY